LTFNEKGGMDIIPSGNYYPGIAGQKQTHASPSLTNTHAICGLAEKFGMGSLHGNPKLISHDCDPLSV